MAQARDRGSRSPEQEAWLDRQRRPDIQIAANDLLSGLVCWRGLMLVAEVQYPLLQRRREIENPEQCFGREPLDRRFGV
jgi:hypothetical protein